MVSRGVRSSRSRLAPFGMASITNAASLGEGVTNPKGTSACPVIARQSRLVAFHQYQTLAVAPPCSKVLAMAFLAFHDHWMRIRLPLPAIPLLALALAVSGADAATKRKAAPPPPAPVALGDTVRVVLTTEAGPITLELDHLHAPVTTENFVAYVDQKRFDGTVFYRSMRLQSDGAPAGLIQAGTQNDPRRILKPIAHEPTTQTGILHKAWTISMARYAPGTATGDFSILLSDLPSLDADPKASGDNTGYAAFGHVVEGQDTVRKIFDAPLSSTLGEGVMRGQMIAAPVRIIAARRLTEPTPPAPKPQP